MYCVEKCVCTTVNLFCGNFVQTCEVFWYIIIIYVDNVKETIQKSMRKYTEKIPPRKRRKLNHMYLLLVSSLMQIIHQYAQLTSWNHCLPDKRNIDVALSYQDERNNDTLCSYHNIWPNRELIMKNSFEAKIKDNLKQIGSGLDLSKLTNFLIWQLKEKQSSSVWSK